MIKEFEDVSTHLMDGCHSLCEAIQKFDELQLAIEIDVIDEKNKNDLKNQIATFCRDVRTFKEKVLDIGYNLETLKLTPLVASLGENT
jgi:hypothetical protein